jgi:ssDNA-binding Zn-finger/Zn-ribbon topoisomerase 1
MMACNRYKMTLEVEVSCPASDPKTTIDSDTVMESLMHANYAVCDSNDLKKMTANMRILKAQFIAEVCEKCGHEIICKRGND